MIIEEISVASLSTGGGAFFFVTIPQILTLRSMEQLSFLGVSNGAGADIASGGKICSTCQRSLAEELFEANYRNLDGTLRRSSRCNFCKKQAYQHLRRLKQLHPPPAKGTKCAVPNCERLGTCLDHDHETGMARGYICSQHNSAFAYCSDSADGVRNLLLYAEQWPA
jgi:hypothetical protein